ncbi:MAG: DUF3866 family protein [Coriobacteriales bacterium]|nr:DUF3866 family protein [Coriobacteriales bacterium]
MRLAKAIVRKASEPQHGVQRLACTLAGAVQQGSENGATPQAVTKTDESEARTENLANTGISSSAPKIQALNYLALGAPCVIGDEVLLNMTALDLALGTGGFAFVVPSTAPGATASGHIMKLRYTPLQSEVLAVEEEASPHHATMLAAQSLEGTPVICCGLHSQVPLVAAACKQQRPQARVVYCMTDDAALMHSFSELAAQAQQQQLIDATITCGQAQGGDLEAVNLYSGLLAARHVLAADAIIVCIGPGVVGTATPFGHGGMAQAQALNAAAALDGVPIAVLRLSFADKRERHQGVSHHSLVALGRATLTEAVIALPANLEPEQAQAVERALAKAGIPDKHGIVEVPVTPGEIDLRGLTVTTMGRAQKDDRAFFSAAFAAGILAARFLAESL